MKEKIEVLKYESKEDFLKKLIKDLELDKKVLEIDLQNMQIKTEAKRQAIERVIDKIEKELQKQEV